MLTGKEKKMCKTLISGYRKKLKKYVSKNTSLSAEDIVKEYEERFYRYMDEADMGSERGRFTSYLNIFSGLAAYEILREKGLTEAEGIAAYDSMCAFIRKLSSVLYKGADLLPNGYKIVRQSLLDDLEGEKKICWDIEILQDDNKGFTYEISRCLYFDTCKEHGYPEFCKVFCTHDWYAFGVLKRHSKFIRQSTIAENGTVCHDTIEKLK